MKLKDGSVHGQDDGTGRGAATPGFPTRWQRLVGGSQASGSSLPLLLLIVGSAVFHIGRVPVSWVDYEGLDAWRQRSGDFLGNELGLCTRPAGQYEDSEVIEELQVLTLPSLFVC